MSPVSVAGASVSAAHLVLYYLFSQFLDKLGSFCVGCATRSEVTQAVLDTSLYVSIPVLERLLAI
jgi:hypothetical protein